MPRLLLLAILALSLVANTAFAANKGAELARQRAVFLKAEAALQKGDGDRFKALRDTLDTYPLQAYLFYADLQKRLATAPATEIESFLTRYADTPLAARLYDAWLAQLAVSGRWEDYLKAYHPSTSVAQQCRHLRALMETGHKQAALDQVKPLWLVGRSQPAACDPVFKAWLAADRLTAQLTWQRITLAMDASQIRLARYLGRYLAPAERPWLDLWIKVHNNPRLISTPGAVPDGHPVVTAILAHGARRLASSDPDAALAAWRTLKTTHTIRADEKARTDRRIALIMATEGHPQALVQLAALSVEEDDTTVAEWRVRAALNQGDWRAARHWINQMPADQRHEERWRYWHARSLEALGRSHEAKNLFMELAASRNYYGFLAADRLGLPYEFEHRALTIPAAELNTLASAPPFQRASELYLLGRITDARREWHHALETLSEPDLLRAAELAHQWGWHDRAILTVARTSHRDDLELRFPVAHRNHVLNQAANQKVDPAWVFAVMRQESAFNPEAHSPAGALGLMQIMPGTGRQIARLLNTPWRSRSQLLDADTNIRFGTAYLRRMMDRVDDNAVLATAAYNAGYQRVVRWLPDQGQVPADLWVETIPFRETRGYVSSVFAYTAIYEQRLGRKVTPLSVRMPPVTASPPTTAIQQKTG